MLRKNLPIAAILAGFALALQAHAEIPNNEFLAKLLGTRLHRQGSMFACFSRQYEETHLAARRSQRVTFVKALVNAYFRKDPFSPGMGMHSYQLSLAFRFRNLTETLTGVAECGDGRPRDSIRGGAHCAGPGANSHLALTGQDILVMTMPDGADLWMPGPVDQPHETVKNPFGPDDKVFLLLRTDLKECEDLAFDRQKPLRAYEP